MYAVELKDFGYLLTFGDKISTEEMQAWLEESKSALAKGPTSFGVFVDMRTLLPLAPETQEVMQAGQKLYKSSGMTRSVVIVNSAILKMQFQRIAKETGIYEWERYIDASAHPDWEAQGIAWLNDAKDPDAA